MFKIYVLYSKSLNKYYIGHTEDLQNRLHRHNRGLVKSTKNGKPWEVMYTEDYINKKDAYKGELQIKSYKNGNAFKKLIIQSNGGQVPKRSTGTDCKSVGFMSS